MKKIKRSLDNLYTLTIIASTAILIILYYIQTISFDDKKHDYEKAQLDKISLEINKFANKAFKESSLLAKDKLIINSIIDDSIDSITIRKYLNNKARKLGASIIYIMDKEGTTIADSFMDRAPIIGSNFSFRPYFKKAIKGEINNSYVAFGAVTKKKGIYFSQPIFINDKKNPDAVLTVKFSGKEIDNALKKNIYCSFFLSDDGIIFSSNKIQYTFKSLLEISEQRQKNIIDSKQFGNNKIQSIDIGYSKTGNTFTHNELNTSFYNTPINGWNLLFGYPKTNTIDTKWIIIASAAIILISFILIRITILFQSKKNPDILYSPVRKKAILPVTLSILLITSLTLLQNFISTSNIIQKNIIDNQKEFRIRVTNEINHEKEKLLNDAEYLIQISKPEKENSAKDVLIKMGRFLSLSKYNNTETTTGIYDIHGLNINKDIKSKPINISSIEKTSFILDKNKEIFMTMTKPIHYKHNIIGYIYIKRSMIDFIKDHILNSTENPWLIKINLDKESDFDKTFSNVSEDAEQKIINSFGKETIAIANKIFYLNEIKLANADEKSLLKLYVLSDISASTTYISQNIIITIVISLIFASILILQFWKYFGRIEKQIIRVHENFNDEIDAHIKVVSDLNNEIIKREEAEKEIASSYNKMAFYFQNSPLSHVQLSTNQEVLNWNYAAEILFGYSHNEAVGKNFFELIKSGDIFQGGSDAETQLLRKTGGFTTTSNCKSKDDTVIICRWLFTPIFDDNGNLNEIHAVGQDLTEQIRAQKELEYNENKYRSIIEGVSFGIICFKLDGTVFVINQNIADLLGITIDEGIGKSVYSLFPKIYSEILLSRVSRNIFSEKKLIKFEDYVDFHTGPRWILFHMSEIEAESFKEKGVQCIFYDITDRKKAEQEIKEGDKLIRNILDNMIDTYYRVNQKGEFTILSSSAITLFGIENTEKMIGKPISNLFADKDQYHQINRTLKNEGELRNFEIDIITFDKKQKTINVNTKKCFDNSGKDIGYEGLLRDVSDRIIKQKEKQEMQNLLVQSEKLASLGELSAGIAHEINNPVGYISSNLKTLTGYVEVYNKIVDLLEKYLKLEPNDFAEKETLIYQINSLIEEEDLGFIKRDINDLIHESIRGTEIVADIVRNLKSFARVDDSEVNYGNIIDGIESSIKIVWNQIKYKCEIFKNFDEIPEIKAYHGQLNQIWMNFLMNSCHAIEDGKKGKIIITTKEKNGKILIIFEDNGIGIPEENLSKIFNPFFTTKEVGKGTGLGLSIAFGIVKKHNGEIKIDSKVGRGTTITVILPIDNNFGGSKE